MQLVILGSSGTYPRPGGACNSYVFSLDQSSLLVDLGPGSLSRLFAWRDPANIDGFLISHLHPDHFLDIYPYRYYLQFSADKNKLPVNVYAPPGAKDKIAPLFSDQNSAAFDKVFTWHELRDGVELEIGAFRVIPYEVPHLPPTFSMVIESRDSGERVFYTADTGYDDKLVDLAKGANLLLCEASLLYEEPGNVAHLTGGQAGNIAREAGVGHLVLTHLWPHYNANEILAAAESVFPGVVELAEDNKVLDIKA